MTFDQVFNFAKTVNAHQDDLGKWVFSYDDDLVDFAKLIESLYKTELSNCYAQIQMLSTDLAAAEQKLRELRSIK